MTRRLLLPLLIAPAGLLWPAASRPAPSPGGPAPHWAFRPIRRPPLPSPRLPGSAHPVDRFLRARMEKLGLRPAPEADAVTLARRVTLDLTGLPPAPEEVDAFLADRRPGAYERLVDRLLASPHYGEKWARPWLDLAHYADTDGYLTDQLRPHAWRYRHWLVEALNRDLPFDRFTIEQLAGDLLPGGGVEQKVATGFLRQTLSNREGGADLEEFRVEQVVDRAATVGTAWLGLTVGCARCHDHKYDPLSQREFFALYAFFDAADEVNVDAPLPGEPAPSAEQLAAYARARDELLRPVEAEVAALQADWERRMLAAAARPGKDHHWDREWEVLGLVWGGNEGEGQLEGCRIVQLPPDRRSPAQRDRLRDYFLRRGGGRYPEQFKELGLAELRAKLEKLASGLPRPSRAMTVAETAIPRRVFLHRRGDFRTPGPEVRPGTPACLPPLRVSGPPGRLDLARWLTSRENPLTARVAVNRAWQELFGTGLVATPEDFGTRGGRPSHPELLDYLADRFRRPAGGGGAEPGLAWSRKRLIRLIVTSAAYRQSSRARPDLAARDPANRLLARQASLRLSSDQVRDAALAVSGLLNRKVGGPSVFPPQPEGVVKDAYDNRWVPSEGADRYRRGLYTFLQRLSPFAQGVTFDAPAPGLSCARRERSNTPLQALTLLNDPVFFEAARALAGRVLREGGDGVEGRLERAFRLCLARKPDEGERARLQAFFREQAASLRADPDAAARLAPIGGAAGDAAEAAAWSCLASVLLNLHEFITRE